MLQTIRINLAQDETLDVPPLSGGSVICGLTFVDFATREYRNVEDGVVSHASNERGQAVFRITGPAGGLDGYICLRTEVALHPDAVDFRS